MTDLTAKQIAWIRSEIGDGTPPTDQDLQDAYDRLKSVRDVVIETVRKRRNALLDTPLSTNVAGVAAVNYSENVKAYERQLTALTRLDDDPTDTPGETAAEDAESRPFQQIQLTRARRR